MIPTRSGRNYSIQSNGSGPGHESQKSKRQECQPRGKAQMEDTRASTSSQRLESTFDIFIGSPEAYITDISVVRSESFAVGDNRDIPVSVQELVYGGKAAGVGTSLKDLNRQNELLSSSAEVQGPRKDRRTSEGGPEEEVCPRKGQQTSGSSPSLHRKKPASKSAKPGQENPKEQSVGKAKGKGKGKIQVEQALPTELQNSQEGEDSDGQCVQYGKKSDGIQEQAGGKIEPIISKELDLVKLSQKNIIGLENVNKDNILPLTHFCARIESKVTLLNQPDDNSISFITRQLKELRIKVQNLENSTGNNAALFQEQLEKSDKERLELKEDIQSSINNISMKNDMPRQSTLILDINVLILNNDIHHTISRNAKVETACNFKDILRLEEWPTLSGQGEYNHMEFMKINDIFKEDFNIPDEYISSRLSSLLSKSAKKWYYKMRHDHGKNSWPLWKEKIISKWENDFWRFKMENSFVEAIFNIERDRPMPWFLKQKDRLTALHPDMSETMIHETILRICGGDLEHAIRSRCIGHCSQKIISIPFKKSQLGKK
ncbi:hypothetical protein O181_066445 [Austropuccinia psidii MF-1]|uniref:Uncharacterized protein n=1 Tax=Austropuccinia psidii MF-1 TaxID=1389203 RepID=A0A9Q3EX35_9BASI|nr:hypothetical protein [Austropuccinia psidii MF-1]